MQFFTLSFSEFWEFLKKSMFYEMKYNKERKQDTEAVIHLISASLLYDFNHNYNKD